jgi:hypothetical protein
MIKEGEMGVIGARVFVATLILACLILACFTNVTFADQYAHYGKDNTCNPHMVNGQAPSPNNQMVLCSGQSGATQWWAEVLRSDGVQVCNYGTVNSPHNVSSPMVFNCPIPNSSPQKAYRGYVHWYVGQGSVQMNHTDQWFKK